MRKIYLFLVTVLFTLTSNAQIVNIPDPNFKAALIADGVDSNGNGEIEVSEAQSQMSIDVPNQNITDMTGIQAFTNILSLYCSGNSMTTLDISGMQQLNEVMCENGLLESLIIANNPSLDFVYASHNNMTSFSVDGMPNLYVLQLDYNNLTSASIKNCPSLNDLSLTHNLLTDAGLEFENVSTDVLNLSYNQLEIFNYSFVELIHLYVSNNPITTVDLSQAKVSILTSFNTPDLHYYNLKNGHPVNSIFIQPLSYVCVDTELIPHYLSIPQGGFGPEWGTVMNSYCSFEPGGDHNTIMGVARLDMEGDGCNDDNGFPLMRIDINDGTNSGATFTSMQDGFTGSYLFHTREGSFTLTPSFENNYFTATPATVTFADDANHTENVDFCVTPLGVHHDIEVTVFPTNAAMPGYDAGYYIRYKNKGNQTESGTIDLQFDDALMDIILAQPTPSGQTTNHVTFSFTGLEPFETGNASVVFNLNSPVETPPLNIDQILHFTATATIAGSDEVPSDNVFAFDQVVVGSFDPNDKTCLEGDAIPPEKVGDYLHYVIRFQNSGTAPALNVVVKDEIDPAKFDIASLQLIASSHSQQTRISGNTVEFIFEGINLPAEQDDEPGSHGFVAFKIKTWPTLALDDIVENTADIFFDFNAPITTNTTSTTVSLLGLDDINRTNFTASPNPVNDILTISGLDEMHSIQIYDLQGRLLQTLIENNHSATLDFSRKSNGIYFVKVTTGRGVSTQKIIKE